MKLKDKKLFYAKIFCEFDIKSHNENLMTFIYKHIEVVLIEQNGAISSRNSVKSTNLISRNF